jgi:hypothetical protein
MKDNERPLTYGLMPRGMGDCGLKDGEDLYGVFLPHNCWAVYADRMTCEAADILGKSGEIEALKKIRDTALADLLTALDKGAITEGDYRWIPGVPGKTCGSRWGALNALMPCGIVKTDDPLITGTMKKLRANMSQGGLPLNTGWMANGLWVAIALDNLAEAHLLRGEGDEAADLLYATLNHGTPLYTWCEERAPEPGAAETTGDRQHLWTPVAVVRAVRDSFLLEEDNVLQMAPGVPRSWLATGKPVGIAAAPTHFGEVSFDMTWDKTKNVVRGKAVFPQTKGVKPLNTACLNMRLPKGFRVIAVNPEAKAELLPDGSGLRWNAPAGEYAFEAQIKKTE